MKKFAGHIDWYIFISITGLMLFSIAFVYSASAYFAETRFGMQEKFFFNHSIRILFAIITLVVFSLIDYHFWQKLTKPIIFLSLGLLVLVFLIGPPINNAYRWLNLSPLPINFQPSELAKFALVLHFSALLTERKDVIKDLKFGILPLIVWTIIICSLIALQPNFSSAMVIFIIACLMMFIGNANLIHLFGFAGSVAALGLVYAVSAQYRLNRLLAYFDSSRLSEGADNIGYQMNQAIIAFGNGGIFGVGPGQSRQSHLFLPESYGDFIFSIIGEEYGYFGVIIVLAVFVMVLWRGVLIVRKAPDLFGYFLSSGIVITFSIYAIISAGVNCGLFPTTGLPMPFVSYGGTAVIIYAAAMGMLLNISAQANVFPRNK